MLNSWGGFWCFVVKVALLLTLSCQCGSHAKTVKTSVVMSTRADDFSFVCRGLISAPQTSATAIIQ